MPILRKAVIPAAGRGTRLRSLAGGRPKEMLPVGGKPMIQRAVQMHILSGIRRIAVVLSPDKREIERFLTTARADDADCSADPAFRQMVHDAEFVFIEQKESLGVAHAVSLARDFVGDEPFALVMPDCFLHAEVPFLLQLIRVYERYPRDMIGFVRLDRRRAHEFGNVGLLDVEPVDPPLHRILGLSAKAAGTVVFEGPMHPKGFAGGVYGPHYFDLISKEPRNGVEIDDVPIHHELIRQGRLFGVELDGIPFDLGVPAGYQSAHAFFSTRPGV